MASAKSPLERKNMLRGIVEGCGELHLSHEGRLSRVSYRLGIGKLNFRQITVCRAAFTEVYGVSERMMKQIRKDIKLSMQGHDFKLYSHSSAANPLSIKRLQDISISGINIHPHELSDLKMSSGYRTQMVRYKLNCFTFLTQTNIIFVCILVLHLDGGIFRPDW
jgi:hypothetical protein